MEKICGKLVSEKRCGDSLKRWTEGVKSAAMLDLHNSVHYHLDDNAVRQAGRSHGN